MDETVDILIVGGGLVGSSLAIALDGAGLRVALAEAAAPKVDQQPSYDERNLALARASVNGLSALGVWDKVTAKATPIRRMHVSRRGEFGAARFDAVAHGLDAFGATLPARELGNGLLARLDSCAGLLRLAPASLRALAFDNDAAVATLATASGEHRLRARLVVGADGTNSFVRRSAGIQTADVDYAQTAFVATVTPQRAIDGCAYERFTSTGPVAVLPLGERRAGVVLTVPTADAARVAALDDAGFLELLYERFGYRLGRLSRPGKRVSYPLARVMAQRLVAPRTVVVGNAAQTLHPIAAQGFNLGLRDALTLAEMLIEYCSPHPTVRSANGPPLSRFAGEGHGRRSATSSLMGDPGDADLLTRYAARRREDREGTAAMSDGLARWTADESLPLKLARSFGLVALDRIAPLQDMFVRRGMGFRANTPRLALAQFENIALSLDASRGRGLGEGGSSRS